MCVCVNERQTEKLCVCACVCVCGRRKLGQQGPCMGVLQGPTKKFVSLDPSNQSSHVATTNSRTIIPLRSNSRTHHFVTFEPPDPPLRRQTIDFVSSSHWTPRTNRFVLPLRRTKILEPSDSMLLHHNPTLEAHPFVAPKPYTPSLRRRSNLFFRRCTSCRWFGDAMEGPRV